MLLVRRVLLAVLFLILDYTTARSSDASLDIIQALNISHEQQGVIPVPGVKPDYLTAWQLRPQFVRHPLPQGLLDQFTKRISEGFSLHMILKQARNSVASLLTISLAKSHMPKLHIISNSRHRHLLIKYCSGNCTTLSTLKLFSPFTNHTKWSKILFTVSEEYIQVLVDCRKLLVIPLEVPLNVHTLFRDASVYFGQDGNNKTKFVGSVQVVKLFPHIVERRLWKCKQKQEETVVNPPTEQPQQDALNTLGNNNALPAPLEYQVQQLSMMVDMLKQQNKEILARLDYLETCECRPLCSHNGVTYREGEMWQQDPCNFCVCQNGRPSCSIMWDKPQCYNPCVSSPCQNGGTCVSNPGYHNYTCQCPPTCYGPECQYRRNPCVYELDQGTCGGSVTRYYFDRYQMKCLQFLYTGCGGNPNNFQTLEDCEGQCSLGACCHRIHSPSVSNLQPSMACQVDTLANCRQMSSQSPGQLLEVVSFEPGAQCQPDTCAAPQGCTYGNSSFPYGTRFRIGCQECLCLKDIGIDCRCVTMTMRKEIRDMTSEELERFQNAVKQLRKGPDSQWEQFRNLYMTHAIQGRSTLLFLPWHRLFLRRMEQKLQEVDCSVSLPYFDFTTDAHNFSTAIIWQPGYFGGNGRGGCVPDHRFQHSLWDPCIIRHFDTSVQIPSMLEVAIAVAGDDYMELSHCLEAIAAYIHLFVGGDFATTSAPYDPLFFAIHSYIDMLFWQWQKKHEDIMNSIPFKTSVLMPFSVQVSKTLSSEADLCVTYSLPSRGQPCNDTESVFSPEGYNILGFNRQGFDRQGYDSAGFDVNGVDRNGNPDTRNLYRFDGYNTFGYDRSGYDRMGFNRYGYNRNGYNRDGFDVAGYDSFGYDRYGYDVNGYDQFGYDKQRLDRQGNPDTSGRFNTEGFDLYCYDTQGLTKEGFDQFGYNIKGYDVEYCNYSFAGPFSVRQSLRIWEILHGQSKDFLMTIPRICVGLQPLPQQWYEQYWFKAPKDITSLVTVEVSQSPQSSESQRFCFETGSFLTGCPCESGYIACPVNPCLQARCPGYPDAICEVDFCDPSCRARWRYNGKYVNCDETEEQVRDYCNPSPCQQGGTCVKSRWPTEPQLVTCLCPPGYIGHYCQYKATQQCYLPLNVGGDCGITEDRWYFNREAGECKRFVFTGCHGNPNNFASLEDCQNTCERGACCYRSQVRRGGVYGFSPQGYDRYGFTVDGINAQGEKRTAENALSFGSKRFDENGLDWQGYDRDGFNRQGVSRHGYDRQGYHARTGFNITGYSRLGEYDGDIGYNTEGYDENGFSRAGFNCYGYSKEGLDYYGLTAGYQYSCRSATQVECITLERIPGTQVVKYSPGKNCDEVDCKDHCGCYFQGKSYKFGASFRYGCKMCTCTRTRAVECVCQKVTQRKEVRDMTRKEVQRYQNAIKRLHSSSDGMSRWQELARIHATHMPQAYGNQAFLPWHRYFLWLLESELQTINCDISIPYFDWSTDAGAMETSAIWRADMFGGSGNLGTECVLHHPFKDYFPPFWKPCLMRNFNTSIKLPDVVNIQLLLNEPSYDKFRLEAESISGLFHQWVGGHMLSPYSPYDPVFYSHYAFIDRLWTLWQERHGLLLYPQSLRYIPMEPFGIGADAVLSNPSQLCVTYVPVTEGGLCNVTEARQQSQRRDPVYDVDGFDRQGYNREGFDSMGFDKNGYSINIFNLDGFDRQGYDRSGYDRYGFNRQGFTPFGFNRNGSFRPGITEEGLGIFDSAGYNKYGFNKYGLDRDGYDVFGFSTVGFDRNSCNYYFKGPFYVRFRNWIRKQLVNLDDAELSVIPRICPPVSNNAMWWYAMNWLNRNDQINRIREIELQRRSQHGVESTFSPRQTSVTEDNLWLPFTPDERFCFELHYYTGCTLGKQPISCPSDLCTTSECVGFPTAECRVRGCGTCTVEWYDPITGNTIQCMGCIDSDGVQHEEGSTWQPNLCNRCRCQGGAVSCSPIQCPAVTCQYPVRLDNQCCARCEGCNYLGNVYSNGASFMPSANPCQRCQCRYGEVNCVSVNCPPLGPCSSPITLPGSCCAVCLDCGPRPNASVWQDHPCRTCKCINGDTICEDVQCPPVTCQYPNIPRGKCCPECTDCLYQGRTFPNHQTFQPDLCTTCSCEQGSVECRTETCPQLQCTNPTQMPGQCCPVCREGCEYDMHIYKNGDFFVPSFNPCLNCSCNNNIVQCRTMKCPAVDLPCANPVRRKGECCPSLCPTCEYEGQTYEHGQQWGSVLDPCDTCTCDYGTVDCTRSITCIVQCPHGFREPDECCPQCTDCVFENRKILNGQKFPKPGENCVECECRDGYVKCLPVSESCPPLQCRDTVLLPGECCPRCKDCVDPRGVHHTDNSEWTDYQNPCSMCSCRNGLITCMQQMCQTPSCRYPAKLPGECCPTCNGCEYQGSVYSNGDIVPSGERCQSCRCRNGNVDCEPVQCPVVTCDNPVTTSGQCCPVCEECRYQGKVYRNGQSFISAINPCLRCLCNDGQVNCQELAIDCNAPCTHPAPVPGQCCPVCENCVYERRQYRDGQEFFPRSNDPCFKCVCQRGSVITSRLQCPILTCADQVTPPGQCCPVCETACRYAGQEYQEGQQWTDSRDPCAICTCQNRRVTCSRKECPPGQCPHGVTRLGECCPTCDECLYERRRFRNGQEFVLPGDPCNRCRCQNGRVTCSKVDCPDLNCVNKRTPPGQCCPVCELRGCSYLGQSYSEGERFVSPRDKCQECECRQGEVRCSRKACPPARCDNPGRGDCCDTCSGCNYDGVNYSNFATFDSPRDTCERCRCANGYVICTKKDCPATPCQHPAAPPGQCCPLCRDCLYEGRYFRSGQEFADLLDQCKTCRCRQGTVTCTARSCPPVRCANPRQGQCCPRCDECTYRGRSYRDGQVFRDPTDACQECSCRGGQVNCRTITCPVVVCTHPVQGSCCKECDGCFHNNRQYRNRETFPDSLDPCKECVCTNGNVQCSPKRCPQTSCPYPVRGACCDECTGCLYENNNYRNGQIFVHPRDQCKECECRYGDVRCNNRAECSECSYNGRSYGNGQRFPDPNNECMECLCSNGNVECRLKTCPRVDCTHPVQGRCCPECINCLYNGQEFRDRQRFEDTRDSCNECYCTRGSVSCRRKQCPAVSCTNPVQGECCLECQNCIHNNQEVPSGEKIRDEQTCQECTCNSGTVSCQPLQCEPVSCPHPAKDQCCERCNDCIYEERRYSNKETFPDPNDSCSECQCMAGFVQCRKRKCPDVNCLNPIPGPCSCPLCGADCLFGDIMLTNGQTIQDRDNQCNECTCKDGSVKCERKPCLPARCRNPVRGPCECPVCTGCLYQGQTYLHGTTFDNPVSSCQTCTCASGNVQCRPVTCPYTCTHPVVTTGCCQVCDQCLFEEQIITSGQAFLHPTDPCQQCTCQSGNVMCDLISCPPAKCDNPIQREGQCCPECSVCDFSDRLFEEGQIFVHPDDKCQDCVCKSGTVTCNKQVCNSRCTHPVPGQCCPNCGQCMYDGRVYEEGQQFRPEPCKQCNCQRGNVFCKAVRCPPLNCTYTVQEPGECCEKCKDCMYQGKEYDSGSTWLSPDNPCMSCQCLGGIVTCAEINCVVPCPQPVPVPGQCCPMCPTCVYNGRFYQNGETFQPNEDACDECTCQDSKLLCKRKMCPSLVDCPAEQVARPQPGECCPTCGGFGTNCTSDHQGMMIRPNGDACVTCECQDFSWVCIHEVCKDLSCPLSEQYRPDGSCCSRCAVCYSDETGVTYQDGEAWTLESDSCQDCRCEAGAIECRRKTCPTLVCGRGTVVYRPPGECCEVCSGQVAAQNTTCQYKGKVYQSSDEWHYDDCTKCLCIDGRVECTRQRCEPISCGSDEVPSLVPGVCCPKCIAKPASCIAFGDPHYRTFDGRMVHFQGTCKYIMATDCDSGDFTIEVQHDDRGVQGVSWAQSLTVKIAGIELELLQRQAVKVNGQSVSLPYLKEPHVFVEQSGDNILLNTNLGVKVIWNGDSYAEVSVPGNYKRKMCGLCGNFNGFPQDDLRLRDEQIATSEAVFGNSWKVPSSQPCEDGRDLDPCISAGYAARKMANSKCDILKGPLFSKCHRVIPPEPFYASCVYDLCACKTPGNCLCDVLSSYALECAQAGVTLNWRSPALCAIGCPEDQGFIFDECGPPCPRTCENRNEPLGSIEAQCFKPCVPSCQCSADRILHENSCIRPEECPNS
ncbi:kielin/chordin-like protein isoform X2 [Lingula anatina]|uniref:Kielin/chordin-like protein isoform X2 n=1 Tax=Lingula anatina TaxID=7574 RepID=A0A1S3JRH7_LINAN|nr:kielin/chordin-like protein isoform X2 [Lingula anatina]|eukprot:XP_013412584.1 kielin/chordin-like protein isoform X2 [Lingula anatina]